MKPRALILHALVCFAGVTDVTTVPFLSRGVVALGLGFGIAGFRIEGATQVVLQLQLVIGHRVRL